MLGKVLLFANGNGSLSVVLEHTLVDNNNAAGDRNRRYLLTAGRG